MIFIDKLKSLFNRPYVMTDSEKIIFEIIQKMLLSENIVCEHAPYADCYYLINGDMECVVNYDEIIIIKNSSFFIKTKKPVRFHEDLIELITKVIKDDISTNNCVINAIEQNILKSIKINLQSRK